MVLKLGIDVAKIFCYVIICFTWIWPLQGHAVNSYNSNGTKFPLVYGKTASHHYCDEEQAR